MPHNPVTKHFKFWHITPELWGVREKLYFFYIACFKTNVQCQRWLNRFFAICNFLESSFLTSAAINCVQFSEHLVHQTFEWGLKMLFISLYLKCHILYSFCQWGWIALVDTNRRNPWTHNANTSLFTCAYLHMQIWSQSDPDDIAQQHNKGPYRSGNDSESLDMLHNSSLWKIPIFLNRI